MAKYQSRYTGHQIDQKLDKIGLDNPDGSVKKFLNEKGDFIELDISNLPAESVTSGVFDIARIPREARFEIIPVATEEEKFALTPEDVQLHDSVFVESNSKMYYVMDLNHLDSEAGYREYTGGPAASVAWDRILNKPDTFPPSTHYHEQYTEKEDFENQLVEVSDDFINAELLDDSFILQEIQGKSIMSATPAPNAPVYPESVGESGVLELIRCKKNLINPSEFEIGGIDPETGEETADLNKIRTGIVRLNPTDTYVISFQSDTILNMDIAYYDANDVLVSYDTDIESGTAISLGSNEYNAIIIFNDSEASTTLSNLSSVQLEYGNIATTYEAYEEIVASIALLHPLRSISKYDVIKNQNGNWGLLSVINTLALDGVHETWTLSNATTSGYLNVETMKLQQLIELGAPILCSHLPYITSAQWATWINNGITVTPIGKICVRISNSIASTLDEFLTFLETAEMKVYYQIKTPTFSIFPDTIQEALNQFTRYADTDPSHYTFDYNHAINIPIINCNEFPIPSIETVDKLYNRNGIIKRYYAVENPDGSISYLSKDIGSGSLTAITLSGDVTGHATIDDDSSAIRIETAVADDSHKHSISSITNLQDTLDEKMNTDLKGSVNGVAELDENGKVPSSQLPSYVDDVVEGTLATFPVIGEDGKIYLDTDTNKTYRWSGSAYVAISSDLALGETASSAYRGDRGALAYAHSTTDHAPANAQKNSDITKEEIEAKLTGNITSHTHDDKLELSESGTEELDVDLPDNDADRLGGHLPSYFAKNENNDFTTTAKNVVGAVNELNSDFNNLDYERIDVHTQAELDSALDTKYNGHNHITNEIRVWTGGLTFGGGMWWIDTYIYPESSYGVQTALYFDGTRKKRTLYNNVWGDWVNDNLSNFIVSKSFTFSSTEAEQTFTYSDLIGYQIIACMPNGQNFIEPYLNAVVWNSVDGVLTVIRNAAAYYAGSSCVCMFIKIDI